MYAPLTPQSIAASTVAGFTGNAQGAEDGLTLAPLPKTVFDGVAIPPRLYDKLLSIRLLSSVPISYMVPDAALLPAESIRFFYVDQMWVDRVIDGVLAAANTGSVDITFSCALNQLIRQTLDKALQDTANKTAGAAAWDPATQPMTGMLIRSDIVRRWPDMNVLAFHANGAAHPSTPVGVLRAEPISTSLFIALFAGTPNLVQVLEPHVGLRFGVMVDNEATPLDGNCHIDARDPKGEEINPLKKVKVPLRTVASRVVDMSGFAALVKNIPGVTDAGSRQVAIELERQRWAQDFDDTVAESTGSIPPPSPEVMASKGIRLTVNPGILTPLLKP